MVSLIELIQTGKLPLNQFMDLETVNWIKDHRPSFKLSPPPIDFEPNLDEYLMELKNYIPDPNWFLVSKKRDSIHGMRHILRVIFHSILLNLLSEAKNSRFFKNSLPQ